MSLPSSIRKMFGKSSAMTMDAPVSMAVQSSNDVVQSDSPLFTANPKQYILNNPCVLRDGFIDSNKIFDELNMGKRLTGYLERPAAKVTAKIVNAPVYRTLKNIKASVATGPFDREFYYLPWREDTCCFGAVSESAEFLLTGPLSGCNVYVVRKDDQVILVHANANEDSSNMARNNAVKDGDTNTMLKVLGGKIVARLARGEYEIPAFVWGHRTGRVWSVYVHVADPFTPGAPFSNTKFYEG